MPNHTYTKEQFWKLYEKLPKELQEAIFSEETANNIYDICLKNKIKEEKVSEIARYTGRVLLGILPPDEFQKTLEKEVGLTKNEASGVAREINRFVFYPVKKSLAGLYKIGATPIKPSTNLTSVKTSKTSSAVEKEPEKTDIYREPIE